ncbi:alpha/beta fold hydrolase [Colwelliaceae bacterium 6471]
MNKSCKLVLGLSLLLLSQFVSAQEHELTLNDCHLDGIKEQVKCGTLLVPENYQLPDGEKISINFAVLPAIDNSDNKIPLMFLAGGPGQAAVELAAGLRQVFKDIRKTRDLILVDQRGTGMSHPLECDEAMGQNVYESIPENLSDQDIHSCLAKLSGDLSQYNSENSVRDFDAVRVALGHKKINIYGGSYGTRAGLVYMRLFPDSLNAAVLDSVGPIEVPIGLFGQSAARSFDLLLSNCQLDDACNKAYPDLEKEFQAVIQRLNDKPITFDIAHPRLGTKTAFSLSKSKFIGTLRMQLYKVSTRSLVPLIIHQAFVGNYQPLIGMVARTEEEQGMYIGLTFNIVCNEDIPKVSADMLVKDADNDFGQGDSHSAWQAVCPLWPQYSLSDAFYQPVTANVPTLILSGNLDPVTPPSNGEHSAQTIPNSHHIIVNNASHTVAMSTCAVDIIGEFLESLSPKELDESCLQDIPNETFMTSLNGNI